MSQVYLSLGSNMGDRQSYLKEALQALDALPGSKLQQVSPIYETKAWGKTNQADFLNLACLLETQLSPQQLLAACQKIELDLDRLRHEHWGPRTIDIDLLFYDNQIIDQANLQIPHPYIQERAFVLRPLVDIAPDLQHPLLQEKMTALLAKLDQSDIRPFGLT